MFKNISILTISAFLLISCQSTKKFDESMKEKQPEQNIEEQIVQEDNFEVIEDEQQAEEINEETKQVEVETVEVQDRVFFTYNSATISDEAAKILDVQVQWLINNPKIRITIEGHCDERGTREYNIALGEKRAASVKNYLEEKGIDSSRIKTISYGKERPAYFGNSASIHAKNRRAVVAVN